MQANKFYVLELFSGHGLVAEMWSRDIFRCEHVTVDLRDNKLGTPTFPATIPDDISRIIEHIREKFPGYTGLLWAGVPCNNYSIANTHRTRNLAYADSLVRAVHYIAIQLGIKVVVIENPGTGRLVGRDVISFMPHVVMVDYCQYGKGCRKRTALWSTVDLRAHGFVDMRCTPSCPALIMNAKGNMVHRQSIEDMEYADRVSYPENLVCAVGMAVWRALKAGAPAGFVARAVPGCAEVAAGWVPATEELLEREM